MRAVIPYLILCPTCDKEHEPSTGKPAPEPAGTPVKHVTYAMCHECWLARRQKAER